jgi:hypothetical protein
MRIERHREGDDHRLLGAHAVVVDEHAAAHGHGPGIHGERASTPSGGSWRAYSPQPHSACGASCSPPARSRRRSGRAASGCRRGRRAQRPVGRDAPAAVADRGLAVDRLSAHASAQVPAWAGGGAGAGRGGQIAGSNRTGLAVPGKLTQRGYLKPRSRGAGGLACSRRLRRGRDVRCAVFATGRRRAFAPFSHRGAVCRLRLPTGRRGHGRPECAPSSTARVDPLERRRRATALRHDVTRQLVEARRLCARRAGERGLAAPRRLSSPPPPSSSCDAAPPPTAMTPASSAALPYAAEVRGERLEPRDRHRWAARTPASRARARPGACACCGAPRGRSGVRCRRLVPSAEAMSR